MHGLGRSRTRHHLRGGAGAGQRESKNGHTKLKTVRLDDCTFRMILTCDRGFPQRGRALRKTVCATGLLIALVHICVLSFPQCTLRSPINGFEHKADFSSKWTYFYMHIGKTAGSSLLSLLFSRSNGKMCFLYSPPILSHRAEHCASFLSGKCANSSNGCFSNQIRSKFEDCTLVFAQHIDFSFVDVARLYHPLIHVHTLTMVRHPVHRYVSDVHYLMNCVLFKSIRSKINAEGNFSSVLFRRHIGVLLQSAYFFGGSDASCNEAKASLAYSAWYQNSQAYYRVARRNAGTFAFVGVVEKMPESMLLLSRLMGWRDVPLLPHENTCPKQDAPAEMAKLFAFMYPSEILFYEDLVSTFDQKYEIAIQQV